MRKGRRGPDNFKDRNISLVEDYVSNMENLRLKKLLERSHKIEKAQYINQVVFHARRNSAIEGTMKWDQFRERRTEAVDRYIAVRNKQGRA